MSIGASIAFFLPIALIISFFASVLRRREWSEIRQHTLRLFVTMTVSIALICVALQLLMEFVLSD